MTCHLLHPDMPDLWENLDSDTLLQSDVYTDVEDITSASTESEYSDWEDSYQIAMLDWHWVWQAVAAPG